MSVTVETVNDRSFRIESGPFTVAYTPEAASLEISRKGTDAALSVVPGGHDEGPDVLRPETVHSVAVDEGDCATAVVEGRIDAGSYRFVVRVPESRIGVVDYRLTLTPGDESTAVPHCAPELAVRGGNADGGSAPEPGAEVVDYLPGTPGSDSAGGTDDINEFVFVGLPDGLDATLLAAVDYGALDDCFAGTGTDMFDVVEDPPGTFGYAVPSSEGTLPAAETVVSANVLALDPGAPPVDEPMAYTKQFVTSLSGVYDRLARPETERVDWPAVAEAGARDLAREANRHAEDGCWHPGGVELVSTMSVVVPYRRYAESFDSEPARALLEPMPDALRTYHDGGFRADSGSEGAIANTPTAEGLRHADTWYYLWGLVQVGEEARESGAAGARAVFLDAADVAVDLARAVDYVFPRWVDVEALEGVVPESSDEPSFQYDCTGAYVYLALQYHELTGEDRYLDEAKAAADRLLETGFEYPFELNTTAIGPAALRWLADETGEERYLEGSYVPLASLLRHTYFFHRTTGEFDGRRVFLLNSAMPAKCGSGNYYANALEEEATVTYLQQYLRREFGDLAPGARDLVGEVLRHKGTSVADSLAPFHDDGVPIADAMSTQSGRRVNREWYLPLEPFGVLGHQFDELGEIAQTLYGTGVYASLADMQYHPLSADLTLYTECAVDVERPDPFRHVVRPLGGDDRRFSAALIGPPEAVIDLAVRAEDGSPVDLSYDADEEVYRLELQGGRRYHLDRTTSKRAVVVEDLDVSPRTVAPGDPFEVTVHYRNTAGRSGHYETEIHVGDDTEQVATELDVGDAEQVTVSTAVDEAGTYRIQAQRVRSWVEVEESTAGGQ